MTIITTLVLSIVVGFGLYLGGTLSDLAIKRAEILSRSLRRWWQSGLGQ